MFFRDEPGRIPLACKKSLYEDFKSLCRQLNRNDFLCAKTYYDAKQMATGYQAAKAAFFQRLAEKGYGDWVKKPLEVDYFA